MDKKETERKPEQEKPKEQRTVHLEIEKKTTYVVRDVRVRPGDTITIGDVDTEIVVFIPEPGIFEGNRQIVHIKAEGCETFTTAKTEKHVTVPIVVYFPEISEVAVSQLEIVWARARYWECTGRMTGGGECPYEYDVANGIPGKGIPPGTIPPDFPPAYACDTCESDKDALEPM